MNIYLTISVFLLLIYLPGAAFPHKDNSAIEELNAMPNDTVKFNYVLKLISDLLYTETDIADSLTGELLDIAKTLKNKKLIGKAHKEAGIVSYVKTHYSKSVQHLLKAEKLFASIGDSSQLASIYSNLAQIYSVLGQDSLSKPYLINSLDLAQKLNDQDLIAHLSSQLSDYYISINEYDKAIELLEESIKINHQLNDSSGLAASYSKLGTIYNENGDYKKAKSCLQKSLEIYTSMQKEDEFHIALCELSLARTYNALNNYYDALFYIDRAIDRLKTFDDIQAYNIAISYKLEILKDSGRVDDALKLIEGFDKTVTDSFSLRLLSFYASNLFAIKHQWDSAYKYENMLNKIMVDMHEKEIERIKSDMLTILEFEKEQKEFEVEQAKNELKMKKNTTLFYIGLVAIIPLILLVVNYVFNIHANPYPLKLLLSFHIFLVDAVIIMALFVNFPEILNKKFIVQFSIIAGIIAVGFLYSLFLKKLIPERN